MEVLAGTGITGSRQLEMVAKNTEASGNANFLKIQVIGVKGTGWTASSWNEGIPSGGVELYDSGNLGGSSFDWQNVVDEAVDFGGGYDYIVVRISTGNVDPTGGDFQGLDLVSLK